MIAEAIIASIADEVCRCNKRPRSIRIGTATLRRLRDELAPMLRFQNDDIGTETFSGIPIKHDDDIVGFVLE